MDIASILKDPSGDLSSKRGLGIVAISALIVALIAEMFGHPIHDHLLDIFAAIAGASIAGATADHFASGGQK